MTVSATTRKAGAAAGAAAAAGATVVAAKALLDRRAESSPKYELQRDEPVDDGTRRIAAGRAASAIAHLDGDAGDDDQAAAIHEARKDLKKLRSALRLVREPLGERLYQRENVRFREAAALLGGARDAEVKLETLAALRARNEDYPDGGLAAVVRALEEERDRLSERLADDGEDAPRRVAGRRIEAGLEAISEWELRGEGFELIAPGLKRGYSRGRKLYAATLKQPSGENVHEWRKRAKDLRYQVRLVREARPDKLGDAVDRAHELTDLLGEHHDLEVLRDDVAGRPGVVGEPDRTRLEQLIERRQESLVEQAAAVGKRLYDEKPKRFVARIEGYFTEWR